MLKSLGFTQNNFLTVTEIQELPKEQGFRELGISPQQKRGLGDFSQTDIYNHARIHDSSPQFDKDEQTVINYLQGEYDAADNAMDVTLGA